MVHKNVHVHTHIKLPAVAANSGTQSGNRAQEDHFCLYHLTLQQSAQLKACFFMSRHPSLEGTMLSCKSAAATNQLVSLLPSHKQLLLFPRRWVCRRL